VNLKPSNVFISRNKEYRIGDLGFVELDSLKYTSHPGKYFSAYSAPEGKDAMNICDYGVNSLMTTVNSPMDITEAIDRAEELYYEGAVRMFRFVKTGMDMR
jgi:hypothetical protein